MKEITLVVWKEGKHYVAQCLNIDVSSFGKTIDEAKRNLKEAVELYFDDEKTEMHHVEDNIDSNGKLIFNYWG